MKKVHALLLGLLMLGGIVSALPVGRAYALPGTQVPGGTNYGFFNLSGCNREPYGVINHYTQGKTTIRKQLKQMRANGQEMLRLPIYHYNGQDTGTVMNSAGGNLSTQNRQNLSNLLADIKAAGFKSVSISMNPQGSNNPANWNSFNQARFEENRDLIDNLRPLIAGSGLPYKIDLLSEGVPTSGQTQMLSYDRQLWSHYTALHGKNDTLGFSIIGADTPRVGQVSAVYQGNYPNVIAIDFYGSNSQNEYTQFINARNSLQQQNLGSKPWVITETYYNNKSVATNLANAIRTTGQTVLYQFQWPLTQARTCSDVDVASPTAFNYYNDFDSDGTSDYVERGVPNGDGNGDGVADNRQANVATIVNPVTGKYATLAVSGGCTQINRYRATAESVNAKQDRTHKYPLGMNDFTLGCSSAGATANVKVFYSQTYDTSKWSYRKYADGTYRTLPSFTSFGKATVNSRQVTTASFTLKDGGVSDDDNRANSSITDPSGPALVVADSSAGGTSDDSDGTLANTGQPLAVLIIVAVALLGASAASVYALSRKHHASTK